MPFFLPRAILVALALIVLLLAGCGGDGGGEKAPMLRQPLDPPRGPPRRTPPAHPPTPPARVGRTGTRSPPTPSLAAALIARHRTAGPNSRPRAATTRSPNMAPELEQGLYLSDPRRHLAALPARRTRSQPTLPQAARIRLVRRTCGRPERSSHCRCRRPPPQGWLRLPSLPWRPRPRLLHADGSRRQGMDGGGDRPLAIR